MVSIILPNYNHASFLKERLDSIFNQTYQDFEVIILDDASTDDSLLILKAYKNHPKVSHFIINQNNTGSPFVQWKKGLELAIGKFIWIAESDDSCDLNFLETQLKTLAQCEVAVANTKTLVYGTVEKSITHPVFKNQASTILTVDQIMFCPILNVSAAVFKSIDKNELKEANFMNYSLIGDLVFYYEFFFGKRIYQNINSTSYFRQAGLGVSSLAGKDLAYLAQYFREHVKFILFMRTLTKDIGRNIHQAYLEKFFHRVRDRISRNKKLSVAYLRLYLYYQFFKRI